MLTNQDDLVYADHSSPNTTEIFDMKIKFSAITDIQRALKAVEQNGDALRYVLNKELFIKIAAHFSIGVEI